MKEKHQLLDHATVNKIPLLYLDALAKRNVLDGLESEYETFYRRHVMFLNLMGETAQMLEEAGIEYLIFKTIKPYVSVTSDIDILIMNGGDYERAAHLIGYRWQLKGFGPESMTFYDAAADVGIDLHREIAVSNVVYMDKNTLRESITTLRLPTNKKVMSLKPSADLAVIAAHSAIKEQMYTLAEYFTLLYYLERINRTELRELNYLTELNSSRYATIPFIMIADALHEAAHGIVPKNLEKLVNMFGGRSTDAMNLAKKEFTLPYKYSLGTVFFALLNKAKNDKIRKSCALQLHKMFLDASFSNGILREVVAHLRRETY
jgi:hypothetical protein